MSGYDEDAYRRARDSAIGLPCPFERGLLARCIDCSKARRLLLAEREAISCTEQAANARCQGFHRALHENARFALHVEPNAPWPFGKEIRVQCGGVLGLKAALGHAGTETPDVALLLAEGIERHGAIEHLPYSEIMRGVVHYEPRRRSRR